MTEQVDIYRSAWTMLRHYGADASAEAERRGREMDHAGDREGAFFWQRVEAAIGELVADSAKTGGTR